jgi:hypothetical protein
MTAPGVSARLTSVSEYLLAQNGPFFAIAERLDRSCAWHVSCRFVWCKAWRPPIR